MTSNIISTGDISDGDVSATRELHADGAALLILPRGVELMEQAGY